MQNSLQSLSPHRAWGCPRRWLPAAHRKTPGRVPGKPALSYYDTRGKTVFRISCGAHFDMRAVYPAAPKRDDTKVSITIANGKMQMDFAGVIGAGSEYDPAHTTIFDQPDLGYARDDPDLYQDKWHALENRVFDFLDSGHPLTISAEGKSYVLPPVNVPRWRARFQKIC